MYQLLLILKYLFRKIAPLIAAVAVCLCTAMVIIVISVMGGFLDMLEQSIQRTTGDVIIYQGGLAGFPYYDELINEVEELPEVSAASPVIENFALLTLEDKPYPVKIMGIRPESYNQVTPFERNLVWAEQDIVKDMRQQFEGQDLGEDFETHLDEIAEQWQSVDFREFGMTMQPPPGWQPQEGPELPGLVVGIEVNPYHIRDEQGNYSYANSLPRNLSRYRIPITLTTAPLTRAGTVGEISPERRQFLVVNEYKSGHYDVDSSQVFAPFDVVQRMLDMEAFEGYIEFDPDTGMPKGEPVNQPALATKILVRAGENAQTGQRYTVDQVRDAVTEVYESFRETKLNMPPLSVRTWREVNARLIGAVGNEKGLVTFLFIIISLVAIFMLATTFWTLVQNKTRDIGVLRAIGASRWGILRLFLGYGLAIGIVGGLSGMVLAYLIVTNLNGIQDFIAAWTGWRMWDPRVYAFDRIPSRLDPTETVAIVLGAVISSVLGSFIAAAKAALVDPIESLRYE